MSKQNRENLQVGCVSSICQFFFVNCTHSTKVYLLCVSGIKIHVLFREIYWHVLIYQVQSILEWKKCLQNYNKGFPSLVFVSRVNILALSFYNSWQRAAEWQALEANVSDLPLISFRKAGEFLFRFVYLLLIWLFLLMNLYVLCFESDDDLIKNTGLYKKLTCLKGSRWEP